MSLPRGTHRPCLLPEGLAVSYRMILCSTSSCHTPSQDHITSAQGALIMSFFLLSVRAIAPQGSFQKLHVWLQVFSTRSPWNTLSPLESPPLREAVFFLAFWGTEKKKSCLQNSWNIYLFPLENGWNIPKLPTYSWLMEVLWNSHVFVVFLLFHVSNNMCILHTDNKLRKVKWVVSSHIEHE